MCCCTTSNFDESSILFPEVSKKFLQPVLILFLVIEMTKKYNIYKLLNTCVKQAYIQRVVQLTYKQKKIGVIYSWHTIVFEQILYIILHVLGVYCNIA